MTTVNNNDIDIYYYLSPTTEEAFIEKNSG